MKLYFSPGACSLSPHIVLREAGIPFELEQVNLGTHKTKAGDDYYAINPKGYVPALRLDNGQVLTEGTAIVQYLADQKPDTRLAPANGTLERYRLQEWLNFVSTEVHKGFSPLFNKALPDEVKQATKDRLKKRFEYLGQHLTGKQYLLGDSFSVADAYLFTILTWHKIGGFELAEWPSLKAFFDRVGERPKVREAIETEKAAREKA